MPGNKNFDYLSKKNFMLIGGHIEEQIVFKCYEVGCTTLVLNLYV